MDLTISAVDTTDGRALLALYRWWSRDAAVARHGRLTLRTREQRPGEMGGAFDVINAVFADASAMAGIGSLLVAYRTWRDTRSRVPAAITIEKDGVSITVTDGSEQEIRRILEVLLPNGDAGEPSTGTGEETEER